MAPNFVATSRALSRSRWSSAVSATTSSAPRFRSTDTAPSAIGAVAAPTVSPWRLATRKASSRELAFLVANRQGETVGAATAPIAEGAVSVLRKRGALDVVADTALDHLDRDKALDVATKFGAIFGSSAHTVL